MTNASRRVIGAAGALLLVMATVLAHDAALGRRTRFAVEDDVLYLPRAGALRAISLGHTELVADLILVRALVYFGGQLQDKGNFRWLDNYLATIVALAPDWRAPYKWAGVATMYNGRPITNESVLRSNHFLSLGVKQFPNDWELAFMLGCNYLFELKTDDAAKRAEYRRQGGEWIRHAAIVGGAPPWIPLLAATVMRREGREEAALVHLEEVYRTTQDEKTREEVKTRLLELRAKLDFSREERDRAAFEKAWKESLPYAPADFFIALGEKRSPRLDVESLAANPVLHLDLTPEDD